MPYIGNSQVAGVHKNNFKILDDISSYTEFFDGTSSSIVDTTNNTIRVPQHRFYHGQRVTYSNGGGGNIGGLTTGTVYYAVADTHSTIKLATSEANALINQVINLSSVGSGSGITHSLNNSFDGVNKKFKLTHSGGIGVNLTNASHATVAINNVVQRPNINDSSFTEGFAIEGGKNIVFKTAPISTDTFWGNTIAEAVGTFDSNDHVIDTFTADGTTTNFSLSKIPPSIRDIHVTLDGVTQHITAFSSLQANVLIFTTAPANGTEIQVKHTGFVGASASAVTGFYGRIGNVTLQDSDILRGDGSLISGIASGIPGISTTGTSEFNRLNVTGVSTFASVFNYFGPKDSGTNEHGISLIYNAGSGVLTFHDQLGDGYIRSYSELFFLVEADQSTGYIGGGYGLRMTSGFSDTPPGSLIPYTINQGLPNLGRPAARFGTLFSEQVNISGVSTFTGNVSFASSIGTPTNVNINVGSNDELQIRYNGNLGTIDMYDDQAFCMAIRSASDLILRGYFGDNTSALGDGYGLDITNSHVCPATLGYNLGNTGIEFATTFSNQLNISGISTFGNDLYTTGRVSIGGENPGHFNSSADNLVVADFSADAGISIFGGTSNKSYISMGSSTFGTGSLEATIVKEHGNNNPLKITTLIGTANVEIETGGDFVVSQVGPTERLRVNSTGATFAGTLNAANYAGLKVEQGGLNTTYSSLSGTFNYEFVNGHVLTYTAATSSNYTPNFRVDSSTTLASKMNLGDVVSATLFVASSSHYCGSSVQIDGTTSNVTTEWVGGSAPSSANGSGYDIYSFTIVKTANTPAYTVFANAISAA